jgi:hypothetical protein
MMQRENMGNSLPKCKSLQVLKMLTYIMMEVQQQCAIPASIIALGFKWAEDGQKMGTSWALDGVMMQRLWVLCLFLVVHCDGLAFLHRVAEVRPE